MLLWTLLVGCWPNDGERASLDFSAIPYDNADVVDSGALISFFDGDRLCPDGERNRTIALFRDDLPDPAPVAIIYHAGAFDFIFDELGDLNDPSFYNPGRLNRGWAVGKAWETLGLNLNIPDAAEENEGALAAALLNAGVAQIYPTNCWGDFWHNDPEIRPNDLDVEVFERSGFTVANDALRLVTDEAFANEQDFQIPVELDQSQIYLIGLGSGSRAVTEILLTTAAADVAGVLVDSPPDLLSAYIDPLDPFDEEEEGLRRIYGELALPSIDDQSLQTLAGDDALPARVGMIWSDADPRLPQGSVAPTAETLAGLPGAWVYNQRRPVHVSVNGDLELATGAVEYLLTGTIPQIEDDAR
ncbi:MAG: hypothetical protein AAFV53_20550 [Myxococcota bacterium]